MAQAIQFLTENSVKNPSLRSLAEAVYMSEFHLQRTFQDWVGVTPKQFLQALHRLEAKTVLRKNGITAAAAHVGYGSDSRLYDNFVRFESVTPGEYKNYGEGVVIYWGAGLSPFGHCLLAWTERGVNKLSFLDQHLSLAEALRELREEWPNAKLIEREQRAAQKLNALFAIEAEYKNGKRVPLKVFVKGTAFQVKVWESLLQLPEGQVATYQNIADSLNKSNAVRAVASAIAKNPVGYLIPCHRVIRGCGAINQYRWRKERKASMLLYEKAGDLTKRGLLKSEA